MKIYKALLLLLIGVGIGVVASVIYTRAVSNPRIEEPEIGGVFDVSFQSNERLRPISTQLVGNLQEYEITTKWSFRNNSEKDIALAIPRQKFWITYPNPPAQLARTQSIIRLGELKEIPEECIREESVTLRPHATYEIIHVRKGVFSKKPDAGLNDVIQVIAKIGGEYQALSCRNRTTL